MSHAFQVLEGGVDGAAAALPLSATANDLRGVVQYLKKRPEGVTLGEAVDAIKKQVFEPAKISAYEALGVVERRGGKLRLGDLGWALARALEPEARVFKTMLGRVEAYRAVLAWADERRLDFLIHPDVAAHWRRHNPDALGINTAKMTESGVVCFFQLCQAAGIGTHIIGKKGQPTRLRLDREELARFVAGDWEDEKHEGRGAPPAGRASWDQPSHKEGAREGGASRRAAWDAGGLRVFVSCAARGEGLRRLLTIFGLAGIDCQVVERGPRPAACAPPGEVMRRCDAGVVIAGDADLRREEDGSYSLSEGLQVEVGAAHVLYEGRVALPWDERLPASDRLRHLNLCKVGGDEFSWEACVELTRLVKSFGAAPSGPAPAGDPCHGRPDPETKQ